MCARFVALTEWCRPMGQMVITPTGIKVYASVRGIMLTDTPISLGLCSLRGRTSLVGLT